MAKNNFSPIISEKKILIIRRKELDRFLKINHFSQKEQDKVKDIKQFFTMADIIFFFLNSFYGDYTVELFLPVFKDYNNFEAADQWEKNDVALCIVPVLERLKEFNWDWKKIDYIFSSPKKNASWQGKYGFGLQEGNMPIVELDINPYVNKPVKKGYINFLTTQLNAYQKKAAKRPEFNHYVQEIKNEIELIKKEKDTKTEINNGIIVSKENATYDLVQLKQVFFNSSEDFIKKNPRKNVFNFLNTIKNVLRNIFPFNRDSINQWFLSPYIMDNTIWITFEKFDNFFKENYISEPNQLLEKKITNMLFNRQAAAMFVFLDKNPAMKKIKLSCYVPTYDKRNISGLSDRDYIKIDDCVNLRPFVIKKIGRITKKKVLYSLKRVAISTGCWREKNGIVELTFKDKKDMLDYIKNCYQLWYRTRKNI